VTHLQLFCNSLLTNVQLNKGTGNLAVKKRVIRQPIEFHTCHCADVVVVEVVPSPMLKSGPKVELYTGSL